MYARMHQIYATRSLVKEETFRVIDVLVVPVLHPDPKRLRGSVKLVLPFRINHALQTNQCHSV